ncbi:MarR family transcriptional regulator [Alkalinema pantanalense CENA528]|uniref:MarR family transcriptional regulator n=1 Tax=Alkalinema pantanalense TaxID=1620705 RepID=UPI003D6FC0FC
MTHSPTSAQPSQGLHYRLTSEEWLAVSNDLRFAEIKVLYYLRTLDPFGDRHLDLRVIDIADALGMSKGTVSKALQVLSDKEYIDLELVTVRVRLNSSKKFPVGNQVSCGKPENPTGNQIIPQETSESCRKLPSPVGNFEELETLPEANSETPHTIHTLQPSSISFSPDHPPQREREENLINQDGEPTEEFYEWLKNRAYELPKRPALVDAWIQKQATKRTNQKAFLKYKKSLDRINIPPAPAASIEPLSPISPEEQRQNSLARLQAKWRNPAWRSAAIAEAMEWGFVVTDDGITEALAEV